MEKYLLGLDNGGTMSKAALYDLEGHEIAVSSRKTELIQPQPGFTERDSNEMWAANVGAIRAVIAQAGIDSGQIVGVAATGHGNGVYLTQADGSPAYNGIISTDSRGNEFAAPWQRDGTFEKILPKTMQSCWGGQPTTINK